MRVIAGSLKGRRIAAPDWPGLRPTSDKLRETLFNVLGPRVAGARVLDLYAGTGAVGLEALSRGASAVTFVERDPRAVALIGENLARCGVSEGCAIIRGPVARGLATLGAGPAPAAFDVIFLDPPYETPVDADLTAVGALAAPGALVVVEHARRHAPPESAGRLQRVRQIRSGDSMLSLYTLGE